VSRFKHYSGSRSIGPVIKWPPRSGSLIRNFDPDPYYFIKDLTFNIQHFFSLNDIGTTGTFLTTFFNGHRNLQVEPGSGLVIDSIPELDP
jgi:hypothetical protein